MSLFNKRKHNALLYITPINTEGEPTNEDKVEVLYCDEDGQLVTSIIDTAFVDWMNAKIHQIALEGALEYEGIAWVQLRGLVIAEQSVTVHIKIDQQESQAIYEIIQMALQGYSQITSNLTKYVKAMILKGEKQRKELEQQYREGLERAAEDIVPEIIEKIEHISPKDKKEIEIELKPKFTEPYSVKTEIAFPVIIIEWLVPLKDTPLSKERMLVLDAEEDLITILIDKDGAEEAKQFFETECKKQYPNSCLAYVLTVTNAGLMTFPIKIRRTQEVELNKLKQVFFKTGQSPDISVEVSAIVAEAKVAANTKGRELS